MAASGDGLIVANSIKVLTQNGICQIDLCLGDITRLKKEDGVDVLVVSAFRGSYVESKTSVIGALSHSLNVSVASLAQDKEEDLRSLYSCWWSKPLPDHLAFKRLLCFETRGKRYDGRPQELVANVFRCLVSILKNEDGSVITPLLNTGDQGYNERSMLKGMVEGAVGWMKAGLPLRLMKLVLYAQVQDGNLQKHSLRNFDTVLATFSELKERYEMQLLLPKEIPLEYDIYLSFSGEDEAVAKVIREKLTGAKDSIRIYEGIDQDLDKDSVFQQDMYSVMMKSKRVVTVLTPNYLQNKACVDQYNIALCCNRRANRDVLAPVYVHSVDIMPTYMGLVQYVDCRPADPSKIQEACSQVGVSLSAKLQKDLNTIAEFDPLQYDIFLSYSHCDTDKANRFVETFKSIAPELKIFFDVQELKTGKSWQRTLYHSIDGSRCMLALLSTPYLNSAVCQEEFALAQAKHFTKGKQHLQLISILLEELDSIKPEFTHIPVVRGTPDAFEDVVKALCPAVVKWVKEEKLGTNENLAAIFDKDKIPTISADDEMEALRAAEFEKNYCTSESLKKDKTLFPPSLTDILPPSFTIRPEHLIFSYHSEDEKYVDFVGRVLQTATPGLRFTTVPSNVQEKLQVLEKARCIVPILSPHYLESPECVQEFHIAIWRQRIANPEVPLMFPIRVREIPNKPTYAHLVACDLSVTDALWAKLAAALGDTIHDVMKKVSGVTDRPALPHAVCLPLLMAAYKILQRFARDDPSVSDEYPAKPALINLMRVREQTKQVKQEEYIAFVEKFAKLVEVTVEDKA